MITYDDGLYHPITSAVLLQKQNWDCLSFTLLLLLLNRLESVYLLDVLELFSELVMIMLGGEEYLLSGIVLSLAGLWFLAQEILSPIFSETNNALNMK